MNNERRSILKGIYADLNALRKKVEAVKDAEEDILARMSEKEQFSTKGDAYEDRIHSMLTAMEAMKDAMYELEEAMA